jgi:protein-S-isoprenylcysteine O-methyltransferase Ste14
MPLLAYVQSFLFVLAAALVLFGAAGRADILGFWLYIGVIAAVMMVSFAALDADLLRERMRPGGQKPPVALRLFSLVLFLHWTVAGLDRGRFHLSDTVPHWLQEAALFAFAAGFGFALWAMRVNRFFSSVIRIQNERSHRVVTDGPYAVIRHPGYAAALVIMLASGVALGSWLAAAVVTALSLPFLLRRAIAEDRILIAALPGYRDYAARVPWRLLPGIW